MFIFTDIRRIKYKLKKKIKYPTLFDSEMARALQMESLFASAYIMTYILFIKAVLVSHIHKSHAHNIHVFNLWFEILDLILFPPAFPIRIGLSPTHVIAFKLLPIPTGKTTSLPAIVFFYWRLKTTLLFTILYVTITKWFKTTLSLFWFNYWTEKNELVS